MDGKIVAAIGGTAVLAGVMYILQGERKSGHNKKEKLGFPTLVNLGNTCYLNSVLQALASISTFVSWINACSEEKVGQKSHKLTSELSMFMQILSKPCYEQESFDPTPIFQSLYSHGWVISLEQQDAHEIFQVLTSTLADEQDAPLQTMQNSVLDSKTMAIEDKSIILRSGVHASKVQGKSCSPFVGLFANQLSCKTCSNQYPVKFESFDTISLSLSSGSMVGNYSLAGLLVDFMSSEMLESFKCSGCDIKNGETKKKRLMKKLSIGKRPQCLCFHINRTYWQKNGVPYKNNAFVKFSETLNIEPFLYAPRKVVKNTEIPRVFKNSENPCTSKDSALSPCLALENTKSSQKRLTLKTVYTLVAVIVHLGGVENGHYVTYRKGEWLGEDKWTLVSDEMTRDVALSHVLNTNAYMLFYQRNTQR